MAAITGCSSILALWSERVLNTVGRVHNVIAIHPRFVAVLVD